MFWHGLWERLLAIFGIEINQRKEYQQNGLQIATSIGIVIIGLTDKQKDELGEIKAIRAPQIRNQVKQNDPLFTVEGGQRVVTFSSPVTGEILAVNPLIKKQPRDIRYSSWIIKLRS
ncbi:biotin/lipoyl attachment domain-containing protein [Paucilactobacillus sp. N302-9]